jgi:hypothetical protein
VVSVLLGNGDGTFQAAAVQKYVVPGAFYLAVGDLNGDGFPDIAAIINSGNGTVTVLINAADWWPATSVRVAAPASVPAGMPFDVSVTALDQYGHVVKNFTGTVSFASSDSYPGMLPSDYTFTATDHGTHTFSGVTLFTAGTQTLSAQDKANASLTGSATLTVVAAPANHFLITAPPTAISGMPFDVMLMALDPYGNVDTNYQGTVTFSTNDTEAGVMLPADYTFTVGDGGDSGVHTFAGAVTLVSVGDQTLTATDMADNTISGNATITVTNPAAPPGGRGRRPRTPILNARQSTQQTALLDRLFSSLRFEHKGVADDPFGGDEGLLA